jgi:hypothetical protein
MGCRADSALAGPKGRYPAGGFLRTRRVVRWVGIGLPRRVRLLAVTGGVISLHECDNYGGPRHLTKKPVQLLFCA